MLSKMEDAEEEEDADAHLLVDWRGNRKGKLVQKTIGFRQAKLRADMEVKLGDKSTRARDMAPVFMELSDSEDSQPLWRKKVKKKDDDDVVLLDSDSEPEMSSAHLHCKTSKNVNNFEKKDSFRGSQDFMSDDPRAIQTLDPGLITGELRDESSLCGEEPPLHQTCEPPHPEPVQNDGACFKDYALDQFSSDAKPFYDLSRVGLEKNSNVAVRSALVNRTASIKETTLDQSKIDTRHFDDLVTVSSENKLEFDSDRAAGPKDSAFNYLQDDLWRYNDFEKTGLEKFDSAATSAMVDIAVRGKDSDPVFGTSGNFLRVDLETRCELLSSSVPVETSACCMNSTLELGDSESFDDFVDVGFKWGSLKKCDSVKVGSCSKALSLEPVIAVHCLSSDEESDSERVVRFSAGCTSMEAVTTRGKCKRSRTAADHPPTATVDNNFSPPLDPTFSSVSTFHETSAVKNLPKFQSCASDDSCTYTSIEGGVKCVEQQREVERRVGFVSTSTGSDAQLRGAPHAETRVSRCKHAHDIECNPSLQRKALSWTKSDPVVSLPASDKQGSDNSRNLPRRKKGVGTSKAALTNEERAEREAEREAEKQMEKEAKQMYREAEKRRRLNESTKRKEEARKQKEALKLEANERKRIEKENSKWNKGRFALKHTTAYIDIHILNTKFLGSHLLRQLDDKDYKHEVSCNPISKSILWKMKKPAPDLQENCQLSNIENLCGSQTSDHHLQLITVDIHYMAVLLEAEEFYEMVAKSTLDSHICCIRKQHPGFRICYIVNKLNQFLTKKDKESYKGGQQGWSRSNFEQLVVQLITHYAGVHARICHDEAEMADHVVGLMRGLAECPYKAKLTAMSLAANGDLVAKGDPNRHEIKKSFWLKALVAIPKVSGAMAIAIAKKYPTMRSLFNAYLDGEKTVLEKEFLLEDLVKDTLAGSEGHRVGPACSRRVYRILMARNGKLTTEDVEGGADGFE